MSNAFLSAVGYGRVTQARHLHRQGSSLNTRDKLGHPALLLALRIPDAQARSSMVRWLLCAGADTGYIDPYTGRNLLTTAAYFNCTAEIHLLLEHGSQDVVAQDNMGRTALHYATVHDNVTAVYDLVQYSRRYCISVNIPDFQGWTPFSIATVLGYKHIRAVLVQIGGDSCEHFILSSLNVPALMHDYQEFHWFMQGKLLRERRRVHKPKSSSGVMRRPKQTSWLSTLLSTSSTSDVASSATSVTSVESITQLLSIQSAQKTPSYQPKADKSNRSRYRSRAFSSMSTPKQNATTESKRGLSFAMAAKVMTKTLSMKKKRLTRQDSKV